jgi:prepilin-type N-terminal cleavage/methylation domain-containing protein
MELFGENKMNFKKVLNLRGVTLIELLIALTILGLAIGAIYRLFITQSKAYEVQDQAVEIQQNIRSAEAILTRQLRMAGYDDDNTSITVTRPVFPGDRLNVRDDAVTIQYEDVNGGPVIKTVTFLRLIPPNDNNKCPNSNPCLELQVYNNDGSSDVLNNNLSGVILDNLTDLNFTYGIDTNDDGVVDNWVLAKDVAGSGGSVVAIQFTLGATSERSDRAKQGQDIQEFKVVSPRILTSRVSLRNPMMKHILR